MKRDARTQPSDLRLETALLGPGRTLHAAVAGSGADIVLLHGALTTHQDWLDGPFGALAALGRAIAVDRPGHGLSERPRFSGDPRLQAAQLRDGLARLGVRRPVLVGHSFGCLCALAFAEQYPDEVAGLVLAAPLAFPELRLFEHGWFAPRATPVLGPLLAELTPAPVDRTLLEAVHGIMFWPARPGAAWARHYPWEHILARDAMVASAEDSAAVHPLSFESRLDLGAIRAPAQILQGNADRVVWEGRQAAPLCAALPDATLTRIAGAGHMLHQSHGEAVVAAVREAVGA